MMDPNANLAEQDRIIVRNTGGSFAPVMGDLDRLRELRKSLRVWLANGGFEPDWTAFPLAAQSFREDWTGRR